MADEIRIELVADAKGVIKAVEKVVPASEKAGKKAADNIERPLKASGDRIKNSFAAIGAIIATAIAGKKFIDAAIQQEAAVNKLNQSLRSMGEFTQDASIELQNFASALQSQSIIGDEVILDQLAFAQAMGASVDQSKEIVTAAADMSAALGIDMNSAVRNLSKTLGGYGGELSEIFPKLKELSKEQLQAGEGVKLLAKQYEGFAKGEIDIFGGALSQAGNAIGDMFEKLGDIIVKSPVMIKVLNGITKATNFMIKNLDFTFLSRGIEIFVIGLAKLAEGISYIIYPLQALHKGWNLLFSGMKTIAVGVFAGVLKAAHTMLDSMPDFVKKFLPLEGWENSKDAAILMMKDLATETVTNFDELFTNYSFSDKITEGLSSFTQGLVAIQNKTNETIDQIKDKVTEADKPVIEFGATFNDVSKDIGKQIQQTLVRAMSFGIQHFTKGLIQGKLNMADFGKSMAGMLGDMAIQIGETLLLAGTGMSALLNISGPAALAAGAGLIALGTVLKSFSGGAGAGAGAATSVPAPVAGFDDTTALAGPLGDALEEEEPGSIERQQQVQLVVQGDVFDSEETGTRLLNILNNEFDQKGGRIAYA